MLKSLGLFFVSLLTYGCTTNSGNFNNVNRNDSNDSYVPRLSEVQRANNVNSINGVYNWKNSFDFSDIDERYSDLAIYFTDNENFSHVAPLSFGNGEDMYFILSISFEVEYVGSTSEVVGVYVGIDYFDDSYDEHFKGFTLDQDDTLSDIVGYTALMFNCVSSFYLDSNTKVIFDHIFTSQDNEAVTSYTGFYTFLNNGYLLGTPNYNLFGTITYSNLIYFAYNFYSSNSININGIEVLRYNIIDSSYTASTFYLAERTSNLVYFDHVKMSRGDFTALNGSLGVFAYVNDSTPSSFEDLLFGIADSNIYMLSSLLNFEMFGMNLYIALAGLITLLVVIFIIRKIW